MYDVIVVGARCAGSPTAMLLAERGYRVLLVDRATFPSDTVSAHHVTLPGVARLARWGLLEAVAASGCPRWWPRRSTPRSTPLVPHSPAAPTPTGAVSTSTASRSTPPAAERYRPSPPTTASCASRCNGRPPTRRPSGPTSKPTSSTP